MTESLLLGLLGGLLGLLLASWMTHLLVVIITAWSTQPLSFDFTPDARIFGYA